MQALEALAAARFVPVVRASTPQKAHAAALALAEGGCSVVEVTMTVPEAVSVMRELAAAGLTVGAGTVLTPEQAEAAMDAGASFLVSPGLDHEVVSVCQSAGRLMIPGALTPSEVLAATRAGAPVVKLFPVESVGGPRYLKLLRDPLPHLRFFPTGGVTLANASQFLANGAIAVGVGSALVEAAAVEAGDAMRLRHLAETWRETLGGPVAHAPGTDSHP